MSRIICIANQKGGVGKTTTTINFGYALNQMGYKVLLVDFDPQSNLTMSLCHGNDIKLGKTSYDLMYDALSDYHVNDITSCIVNFNGVDILPAGIELSAMELNLVGTFSREYILKRILKVVESRYDFTLIDTMPSLGLLTINALTASNEVLITVTPQYLSAKGLEMLLTTIRKVKENTNESLEISGILLTMFADRIILSREIFKMIEAAYGGAIKIFDSKIPNTIKVGEAILSGLPIMDYLPESPAAIAYEAFAKEYMDER